MSDSTFTLKIPIPPESMVLGVIVMCKYIDSEGEIHYSEGADGSLSPIETLGMITSYGDAMRRKISQAPRR
jgi:hypothetical protein